MLCAHVRKKNMRESSSFQSCFSAPTVVKTLWILHVFHWNLCMNLNNFQEFIKFTISTQTKLYSRVCQFILVVPDLDLYLNIQDHDIEQQILNVFTKITLFVCLFTFFCKCNHKKSFLWKVSAFIALRIRCSSSWTW